MDNMFNKPYEISLWEDYVVYRRQKLKPAEPAPTKKTYKPGDYYSQNLNELGNNYGESLVPYTIDYLPYDANKDYYVSDNKVYLEGESMDDLYVKPDDENWYADGKMLPNTIIQFYKEQKTCVIGSDSMDTPLRAYNGKLIVNTNGSSSLTFSMQHKYYDADSGTLIHNPFTKLLVNERKVKLRHGELGAKGTKWYDFIIKNVQENSETKTFKYTAKNLFINELSKSGFSIELDAKLKNNIGTVVKLGRTVLEGSDWQIPEGHDLILRQTNEEPLYRILLKETIKPQVMIEEKGKEPLTEIGQGEEILGFYTSISNQSPFFQFLYVPDDAYTKDENNVITNSPSYYLDNVEYDENTGLPTFAKEGSQVTLKYRGARIVRQPKVEFDPILNQYVAIYKDMANGEKKTYGYSETEYLSPVAVNNYITNSKNFDSTTGWKAGGALQTFEAYESIENKEAKEIKENVGPTKVITPEISVVTLPDVFSKILLEENADLYFNSYLGVKFTSSEQKLYNSGVSDFRQSLNGFTKGSQFVMRMKYGIADSDGIDLVPKSDWFDVKIFKYELQDGIYVPTKVTGSTEDEVYFSFEFEKELDKEGKWNGYVRAIASCLRSMSYSEMTVSRLGLFICPTKDEVRNFQVLFEDVQFFPYMTDVDGNLVIPETVPKSGVKEKYYFYYPNQNVKAPEEIIYEVRDIYELPTLEDGKPRFVETYNDDNGYNKIRSITASESNRFNLIQDLCETFECWSKFDIEHNEETGEILLGKDKTWFNENKEEISCPEGEKYRQQKFVTFHEYIGKQNDIGFKYGINLKTIQRTLESDAIVSKMVVKANQNEQAIDGFCTIQRASENPTGENVVYDFSYYINQCMLDADIINGDLYLDTDGYLGYYKKLKYWNKTRDKLVLEQSELSTTISELKAKGATWKTAYEQSEQLLAEKRGQLYAQTSYTFEEFIYSDGSNETLESWKDDASVKSLCAAIASLESKVKHYNKMTERVRQQLVDIEKREEEIEGELRAIKESKLSLELQFYKKYSRFIQEGSWIDENYIDDNLYYLDATSTLHTSSQPKVSYTIDVLELSCIPEYENYIFSIGDKTFIEDTEFFGWTVVGGIQTPRKEEIIVNEITVALDSPEQNQIKVQNYKTQFEDLFQRITATTQNVDYSTGKYNKATSIVETDGTIKVNTLQNSIANNSLIISNAKDQSVIWDETGITTTSLSSPNEVVRIVSGGIFLSTDGGVNWNTGISGKGINANYITTGQLDTSIVQILAGAFPSFRWDSAGLSAYEFELEEDGKTGKNFNYSKFIRFDQFGLYGIKGFANFNPLEETEGLSGEEKIWKYADFALTWKGFQLRNKYGDGYVSISSTDDFVVSDGENIRIKIGNLGTADAARYGIKIADAKGNSVMETADDGTLWLKNSLNIETYNKERVVAIGKLSDSGSINTEHGGQVINATENFIVYEDGHVVARSGSFNGRIEAIEGTIGGFTISNNKLSSENANARIILGKEIESCISLDGANQAIIAYKGGSLDNFSWRLSSDGAIFNNITARGSIKAATFEYGAVQAIGGILLVRPSSKIKKIVTDGQKDNVYILYPETEFTGFKKNDVCLIEKEQGIKEYFTILEVEDNLGKVISIKIQTNNKLDDSYIGAPIINLGSENSVGIGINGSTNDAFIPSNSISVLEFNGVNAFRNKIILGKLPEQKDRFGEAAGKYGLYAENVFLTGFLTAEAKKEGNTNYSGIGTTLSANGPSTVGKRDLFPNADQQLGQILIWAGAKGTSKEAIEKAPFFVDQYGNMYAGSAYFKGTVITESTIEAAEIKTAIITGTGNQSGYGLVIKDLQKGIIFQKDGENVFSLGVNGLETSLNASFSGELLAGELAIHGKKLSKKNATASVIFEDTEISLKTTNAIKFLEKSNSEAEDKIIGEYKQVEKNGKIVGYDLYIYEE